MTVYLSAEDVFAVAEAASGDTPVARDVGLVAEAAYRPTVVHDGADVYPGVVEKAAALLQSLAVGNAFVGDRHRTAWLSCVTFLALNAVRLRPDAAAAERLVTAVADGETYDVEVIAAALRELIVPDAEGVPPDRGVRFPAT
ncbi:type II toxin-antitoxin system death-on-curing family toxin [Streptomyces sp. NPDC056144]|uniref:type II toxin-antitoxin system death-on-curing family toxin n=1 Tax=unclassified Streptomyces TaxID=2593676 RepID=UPI0035D98778